MEYEPDYTEEDERIDTVKDRIYDLEEMKDRIGHWIETDDPDYDDLKGYFIECIKEINKLINDNKDELNELLEEPRLYDDYKKEQEEQESEYWKDQF